MLSHMGYIRAPAGRPAALQRVRQHLVDVGPHPMSAAGHADPTAYLEHCIHAGPIVRKLFADNGLKPMPTAGFRIHNHSRYDTGSCPPDTLPVCAAYGAAGDCSSRLVNLYLFNWTGNGLSGFHYDALLPTWLPAAPPWGLGISSSDKKVGPSRIIIK